MSVKAPRYLGPVPHPAIGVRIPDVFLRGIISAYKMRRTAGGLMLSCTREAAPKYVIDSPPGKYALTLGHTGVSIREYITKCAEWARKLRAIVELESDHLIVGSYLQAVQRILGNTGKVEITAHEIESSLGFVFDAVDEAVGTGFINSFTVDTTSLVDMTVEKCTREELAARFRSEIIESRALLEEYSREFCCTWIDGSLHTVKFDEEEIMRIALQFRRSLENCFKIYSHIRKAMGHNAFGFELTLDELPKQTGKELLYYLREWKKLGAHTDFVAPNVGFRKRADFQGDLRELKRQLSFLAAVAHSCGALLSIHSGSGESPYGGKGKGVYQTIVEATGGMVKYKISGVYFELLMDLLAKSRVSKHKNLFERIFEDVVEFWQDQVDGDTSLADGTLKKTLDSYRAGVRDGREKTYSNRSDFFRLYSFVSLNLRDESGRRYIKDELLKLYQEDRKWRKLVDKEVEKLTLRLIDGVNFGDNLSQIWGTP